MATMLPTQVHSTTFSEWSAGLGQDGLSPLVYIVGTRGKSTIARLLDSIARESGLRTVLRTDSGVEIEGKRQLGDIHPLSEALEELDQGELDLAILEMSWSDLQTLPVGHRRPGAIVVATICPHRDYCMLEETKRAIAGLKALLLSTHPSTLISADIDDSAFPSLTDVDLGNLVATTASSEHPGLRRHLGEGGMAAWTTETSLQVGTSESTSVNVAIDEIPLTMNGAALFQMRNVMAAAAIATAIGFTAYAVRSGLTNVTPDNASLPTGLNSFRASGVRIVIDRPSPSWFLGPLLRATRALKPDRVIFVLDYRDVANQDDSVEVGRMIGRNAALCVVTNEPSALASVVALKAGIARNEITPPIVHTESLPKAVLRGLASADKSDLVVVLTSRPQTVYRTLARQRVSNSDAAGT